jgi:hypothetical protein
MLVVLVLVLFGEGLLRISTPALSSPQQMDQLEIVKVRTQSRFFRLSVQFSKTVIGVVFDFSTLNYESAVHHQHA